MPITTHIKNSDTLVIAFPGHARKLGMPVDEFFQLAGLQETSRVVIFDDQRLKMLNGLPPEFETFEAVLEHLREIIRKHGFQNVWTTGTSGGAYTAIMTGHLLGANHVVAFAPYAFLSYQMAVETKDPARNSWKEIFESLNALPDDLKRYLDLRDILSEWNGKTEYDVHVSRYHAWDYKRSLYLKGLPHVNIITHAYDVHSLTEELDRRGVLKSCYRFPFRRERPLEELCYRIKYGLRALKSKPGRRK